MRGTTLAQIKRYFFGISSTLRQYPKTRKKNRQNVKNGFIFKRRYKNYKHSTSTLVRFNKFNIELFYHIIGNQAIVELVAFKNAF
jgi:hypothetical protein